MNRVRKISTSMSENILEFRILSFWRKKIEFDTSLSSDGVERIPIIMNTMCNQYYNDFVETDREKQI